MWVIAWAVWWVHRDREARIQRRGGQTEKQHPSILVATMSIARIQCRGGQTEEQHPSILDATVNIGQGPPLNKNIDYAPPWTCEPPWLPTSDKKSLIKNHQIQTNDTNPVGGEARKIHQLRSSSDRRETYLEEATADQRGPAVYSDWRPRPTRGRDSSTGSA